MEKSSDKTDDTSHNAVEKETETFKKDEDMNLTDSDVWVNDDTTVQRNQDFNKTNASETSISDRNTDNTLQSGGESYINIPPGLPPVENKTVTVYKQYSKKRSTKSERKSDWKLLWKK